MGEKAKKLTPAGFEIAANTYLDGILLADLLSNVKLATDDDGKIKPHVIENLRTILSAMMRKSKDEIAVRKLRNLYDFLNDYL